MMPMETNEKKEEIQLGKFPFGSEQAQNVMIAFKTCK